MLSLHRYMRGSGSRVDLPTTTRFTQASVELDRRTSYTFAINVSDTDPAPNFLYHGIESNLRWNLYGRSR